MPKLRCLCGISQVLKYWHEIKPFHHPVRLQWWRFLPSNGWSGSLHHPLSHLFPCLAALCLGFLGCKTWIAAPSSNQVAVRNKLNKKWKVFHPVHVLEQVLKKSYCFHDRYSFENEHLASALLKFTRFWVSWRYFLIHTQWRSLFWRLCK